MMMSATQESTVPQALSIPRLRGGPAQFRVRDTRRKSPAIAAILSMMPGLGQVYVGYYQRGFVHAVVVASLNHEFSPRERSSGSARCSGCS